MPLAVTTKTISSLYQTDMKFVKAYRTTLSHQVQCIVMYFMCALLAKEKILYALGQQVHTICGGTSKLNNAIGHAEFNAINQFITALCLPMISEAKIKH
jgi:hypothetical protein